VALAAAPHARVDSRIIYGFGSALFLAVAVSVPFDRLIVDADRMTVVDRFRRKTFNIDDVSSVDTRPSTSPIFTGGGMVEIAIQENRRVPLRGTGTFSNRRHRDLKDAVASALRIPTT
jgi:hypothetical protein